MAAMDASAAIEMDGRLRPHPSVQGRRDAILSVTTAQCHAANLMLLANGDLGCVWFGGTQEGLPDISIHFARLAPGSSGWSPAVKLVDDPARSEQNPILFPAPDGRLLLFYTSQQGGNQDTAIVRVRTSVDHGATWSPPTTLIDSPGTFVRQPPYVARNGDWLLPVFRCPTVAGQPWTGEHDTSAVRVSSDQGRTWVERPVRDSLGAVHMCIVASDANELLALYRSRWADHIYASRSTDDGASWSPPVATSLPNNNASIQATRLRDGRIALAYNHSSRLDATARRASLYDDIAAAAPAPLAAAGKEPRAFWGAPRAPLALALSGDGGRSWSPPRVIDTSDGYCITNNSAEKLNRELSYPSIVETADGCLHLAFTWYRQTIKHVVLERA